MSVDSGDRLSPLVFVVGGALALAIVGFVVDTTFFSGTTTFDGPLSDVTTYNFTLLGAVGGGIAGAFVGFGLI